MLKKITITSLILLITACSYGSSTENRICPRVLITRGDSYLIQKSLDKEDFMVELVGFDGYCYFDRGIKHDKAIITPIFKIKRLSKSDETDVLFSFYAETVMGPPEYLGKKTYYETARIPLDKIEIEYEGKEAEVRIPPEMKYDFDINLGINIGKEDKKYNQRTFDVPLGYEE